MQVNSEQRDSRRFMEEARIFEWLSVFYFSPPHRPAFLFYQSALIWKQTAHFIYSKETAYDSVSWAVSGWMEKQKTRKKKTAREKMR